MIVLPNLALFYVSLWLTIHWWYPAGLNRADLAAHFEHFSVIFVLWLITFLSFRLFEREPFRRYTTLLVGLGSASLVNLALGICEGYFQPALILTPRRFLLVLVGLSFLFILIWDLILKLFVFNRFVQSVYLYSFDDELKHLQIEIAKHDYLGFKVVGHITDEELPGLPAGSLVIFPDHLHQDPRLTNSIFRLRKNAIAFFNHNDFYESLLRRVYIPSLDQIWFLQNITYSRNIFYWLVKSFFDYLVGIIVFLVFVLTYPFVAIGIKLSSAGPVIFRQLRVGIDGQNFTIYKYRTMVGESSNKWTAVGDARITRFGKFLRLARLDELPQSLNLLQGNMSLVGPRPEQVGIVEDLKKAIPFYEERHTVKPGLTGWAQLNVYAGSLEESKLKLEYDLYYLKNQSLLLDLEIIVKTIYNVVFLRGQ